MAILIGKPNEKATPISATSVDLAVVREIRDGRNRGKRARRKRHSEISRGNTRYRVRRLDENLEVKIISN